MLLIFPYWVAAQWPFSYSEYRQEWSQIVKWQRGETSHGRHASPKNPMAPFLSLVNSLANQISALKSYSTRRHHYDGPNLRGPVCRDGGRRKNGSGVPTAPLTGLMDRNDVLSGERWESGLLPELAHDRSSGCQLRYSLTWTLPLLLYKLIVASLPIQDIFTTVTKSLCCDRRRGVFFAFFGDSEIDCRLCDELRPALADLVAHTPRRDLWDRAKGRVANQLTTASPWPNLKEEGSPLPRSKDGPLLSRYDLTTPLFHPAHSIPEVAC